MKRPRLFQLLMLAFALVIASGLLGMVSLLGLTFAGQIPGGSLRETIRDAAPDYAAALTDYYVANGNSWQGVEQRLNTPPFAGPSSFYSYAIVDEQGNLIANTGNATPDMVMGMMNGSESRQTRRPNPPSAMANITIHGRSIGVLLVRPDFDPRPVDSRSSTRPSSFLSLLWRNFLFAALTIGGLLFALAAIFSGRINRPLRNLIAASEGLAAGKLDTRVPHASVRELDELASAFNRMADSLAAADAQRRQMTADVAHELRTPLSIIRGRLEGMQDAIYTAEPEQINALLHETSMLERLVEDLRLLALAEAGQLPLYREHCNPHELLEQVADAFDDQAKRQQIALEINSSGELPNIYVDPQRIAQVLANLVNNALRHTPEGGSVRLSAALQRPISEPTLPRSSSQRTTAGIMGVLAHRPNPSPPPSSQTPAMIEIKVSDTGLGIASEDLPYLFDRFWRADRSRARGSGGAGLGLAIVKQIIDAHGGQVTVDSTPGSGTTFTIRLAAE